MEELESNIQQENKKLSKPLIAGIAYFSAVVLFILLKIAMQLGCFSTLDSTTLNIVSTILIQIIIVLAVPFAIFSILSKKNISKSLKEIGFRKISGKSLLVCFGMGVCVYVVVLCISNVWSFILTLFGVGYLPSTTVTEDKSWITNPWIILLLDIVLTAVLPAICEEILHRGILLNGLKKGGVVFALLGSSLCFGLLHMNIFQCVYAFVIGLLLGYLMLYTKSIVPCMIIHFMNNFINVLSDNCYQNGWLGGGVSGLQQTIMNSYGGKAYFLFVIILSLSVVGIIYGCKYLIKKERLEKELKAMPQEFHEYYNNIKTQSSYVHVPSYSPYYAMIQSEYAFFMAYLQQKSNARKCSILEVLELPNGVESCFWYDKIFAISSIISAGIFTLISFFYYVI